MFFLKVIYTYKKGLKKLTNGQKVNGSNTSKQDKSFQTKTRHKNCFMSLFVSTVSSLLVQDA